MKYLKYFLGLILILMLIFFGLGLLTPSIYYESEVVVNKSAKEAWAVMNDEKNLPNWIKGFKRTELISGTANTVGSVSNVYVEENGQEMIMKETIKDVVPNELLSMVFTMDIMNMDYDMVFAQEGEQTTITSKSTTKGNGLFAKSIVYFMAGTMKAQEDENLNNLKKIIEENTVDYFPEAMMEEEDVQ